MNTLQRRRQFYCAGMATITFHGNGGLTAAGDAVVMMQVSVGSVWSKIQKPSFSLIGQPREQNGFTTIQNDDTTVVGSDYVVTGDMVVYASYTVVEMGVVTYAGEIMSVGGWINKYGVNLYEKMESSPLPAERWAMIPGQRENLISFLYIKASDSKSYAIPFAQELGNARIGPSQQGNSGADMYALGGYGMDISADVPFSVNSQFVYGDSLPVENRRYPGLHIPPYWGNVNNTPRGIPQDMIDLINNYDGGLESTITRREALRGAVDSQGAAGSPYLESFLQMPTTPVIDPAKMYLMSPFELSIALPNYLQIHAIVDELEQWRRDVSAGRAIMTPYYIAGRLYWESYNLMYSYWEVDDREHLSAPNGAGSNMKMYTTPVAGAMYVTAVSLMLGWTGGSENKSIGVLCFDGVRMKAVDADMAPQFAWPNEGTGRLLPVVDISHLFNTRI